MKKTEHLKEVLKNWEKLDKLQDKIEKKCESAKKSMPYYQPSSSYLRHTKQQLEIAEKKAKIWNKIRSFTPDGKTTLWQRALKSKYPVKYFGQETTVEFKKGEILKLINMEVSIKNVIL